jgi:hypothetical protein
MKRVQEGSKRRRLVMCLGLASVIVGAYLFGALSHSRNYFPIGQLRTAALKFRGAEEPRRKLLGQYDEFGRLMAFPGKHRTECPTPGKSVAVLLSMGQSNSANHGEKLYQTRHPGRVVNFFDGACYDASSPLLGATGERGEFMTLLADMLVESGRFSSVVLVASGVGGTPVSRWQRDGDLNDMLLKVVDIVQRQYRFTHVLFHQGEADFRMYTSAKVYASSFNSLKESLREIGVDAPFFVSISTKCGRNAHWIPDNPTASGQQMVVAGDSRVFLGANTDSLLLPTDRTDDECHFRESGQVKTAKSFAHAIEEFEDTELHAKNIPEEGDNS